MLEVLVAGVVLAIGLLATLELLGRTAATTAGVQDRARALMFARSKMDEILKEPVLQVGSDKGEGVDQGTDYDWEASIEQSENENLYLITILARNRVTQNEVAITALRRPDLQPPTPEETGTTTTDTPEPAAAGGGT
jgi:hypothetical protein